MGQTNPDYENLLKQVNRNDTEQELFSFPSFPPIYSQTPQVSSWRTAGLQSGNAPCCPVCGLKDSTQIASKEKNRDLGFGEQCPSGKLRGQHVRARGSLPLRGDLISYLAPDHPWVTTTSDWQPGAATNRTVKRSPLAKGFLRVRPDLYLPRKGKLNLGSSVFSPTVPCPSTYST